jgi:hypothetical protein
MSDDKGSPLGDLGKGLFHLYKAARKTMKKLPTEKVETAVAEVGRAARNVSSSVEKGLTGRDRRTEVKVFVGEVKNGELKVKEGVIAFAVLSDLCDAVRDGKCAHGTITIRLGNGRAHLDADGDFGKTDVTRLRGIVDRAPIEKLMRRPGG